MCAMVLRQLLQQGLELLVKINVGSEFGGERIKCLVEKLGLKRNIQSR